MSAMSRRVIPLRYIVNVSAYEVMDRTHCHLQVGQWSPQNPRTEKLYSLTFTTPSEGIEDPAAWAKALLVEFIEHL